MSVIEVEPTVAMKVSAGIAAFPVTPCPTTKFEVCAVVKPVTEFVPVLNARDPEIVVTGSASAKTICATPVALLPTLYAYPGSWTIPSRETIRPLAETQSKSRL